MVSVPLSESACYATTTGFTAKKINLCPLLFPYLTFIFRYIAM